MPALREWCGEAHVAHWEQDADELPTGEGAHHLVLAESPASALARSSPGHSARTVAPPVVPG